MQKLNDTEESKNMTRDTEDVGEGEAIGTEYGEAELEILNKFLQETCCSLLAVNKDLLNRELHTPTSVDLLKGFASDKSQRALVVAKIEKSSNEQQKAEQPVTPKSEVSSVTAGMDVEIMLTGKVEYITQNAQTIAFLKREEFAKLDLKLDMELEKVLESAVNQSQSMSEAGQPTEERVDLSSQIQIINLGYLGQDSNIFELASTYVDFSFLPLFHDYKNKTQIKNPGQDQPSGAGGGLEGILKGLSSLKMHLAQCRQNLDIPMVELRVDPEVKAKFDECKAAGTFVKESDFEDRINDPDFVNRMK